MKMNIITAFSITAVVSMASCGTAKKLEQTTNELSQLKETSAQQSQKIASYESEIKKLKEENAVNISEAKDCQVIKDKLQSNLKAINNALAEQGKSVRNIHNKVEESLLKFANAGVDVSYKNGLVHIHLEDQLVFNSGSTTVGWEGKQALALVAEEVNKYPKVDVYVIGNTDDVPVKSGSRDNWSISTERANAIVRVLRDEYQVDPSRIISGGRSMYRPVADNLSEGGRARNRRTDIIINPKLDRIWELSGSEN
jgi:chemotaxis protein MotB